MPIRENGILSLSSIDVANDIPAMYRRAEAGDKNGKFQGRATMFARCLIENAKGLPYAGMKRGFGPAKSRTPLLIRGMRKSRTRRYKY